MHTNALSTWELRMLEKKELIWKQLWHELPLFASSLQDMRAATFPSLSVMAGQGGDSVLSLCCGSTEGGGSHAVLCNAEGVSLLRHRYS